MTYRYTDRTIIITGGAGDIGKALGRLVHARGMNVVIGDINERGAQKFANELGSERTLVFAGDLTDKTNMSALLDQTIKHFGGLDVLGNNLAMNGIERFHERSIESIEREILINLTSPLVLTRMAVPYLQKSDDPRVLTTTSLGAIQPLKETPIYCATKFGLRGGILSIAQDEELHGIKFSCVLPTAADTYMLRQEAIDGGSGLNFIDLPQTPEEVAVQFIKHLEKPRLERYPKFSDSILCRIAMLFPNLQPRLLPYFEERGKRGLKKYVASL